MAEEVKISKSLYEVYIDTKPLELYVLAFFVLSLLSIFSSISVTTYIIIPLLLLNIVGSGRSEKFVIYWANASALVVLLRNLFSK